MQTRLTTKRLPGLRHSSPPPLNRESASPIVPEDQVELSDAARNPERKMTFLSRAAMIAMGAGMLTGSIAGGASAQTQTSTQQTIDDLIRQVLQEDLGTISNPRFSEFPQLTELTESRPFQSGEEGPHIEAVQQTLLDLGFHINAGATGGLYNQTLSALNNFRASVDMEPRRDLDLATMQKLDELAPPPGHALAEHPTASFPDAQFVNGQVVRVVVRRDEHRLFLYNNDGSPQAVYPVATGTDATPTHAGLKVVNYKYTDPTEVANKFWPESGGKAFGTRMVDLKWYDAATGETTTSDEEIHGTYSRGSIGSRSSNGCIRLVNENMEALFSQLGNGDLVRVQ